MYDYLIVGAGLFGSIFAYEASKQGKNCLVIDRRSVAGGNLYTKCLEGINVHMYGAHIFHSNSATAWNYIRQFAKFNGFINSPLAYYKGVLYNLPFNMNTFYKLWGTLTPQAAQRVIEKQSSEIKNRPKNLEEHAISLVGRDIYEMLIKGYTEKQWGRRCVDLPCDIMRRIPVRMRFDNNYYDVEYQGCPVGGYTQIFDKMLSNCDIEYDSDYNEKRDEYRNKAKRIIYTGTIDSYFDYCYGPLEYRGLRFDTEVINDENYQGNAVINYTEFEIPYTRIIEHKFFEFGQQDCTVISREYPIKWNIGEEPYYPINDKKNNELYRKYSEIAEKEKNIVFGGRLGSYQYYDMGDTIEAALDVVNKELK